MIDRTNSWPCAMRILREWLEARMLVLKRVCCLALRLLIVYYFDLRATAHDEVATADSSRHKDPGNESAVHFELTECGSELAG